MIRTKTGWKKYGTDESFMAGDNLAEWTATYVGPLTVVKNDVGREVLEVTYSAWEHGNVFVVREQQHSMIVPVDVFTGEPAWGDEPLEDGDYVPGDGDPFPYDFASDAVGAAKEHAEQDEAWKLG